MPHRLKLLYIGRSHNCNDPRLYYRQIATLKSKLQDIDVIFLSHKECVEDLALIDEYVVFNPYKIRFRLSTKVQRFLNDLILTFSYIKKLYSLKPDIIQISDVDELSIGAFAKIIGLKVIFDDHEDKFNQIYEFEGKGMLNYLEARMATIKEFLFVRFADIVFCTDNYLKNKYGGKKYGAKSVHLLRNFPPLLLTNHLKKKIQNKDDLKLVYIGSLNKYKGINEMIDYVNIYNQNNNNRIYLNIYSNVQKKNTEFITYHKYINYDNLIEAISKYDVGVCLWHPIKKLERNLPIKNFDYMLAGLPIITSNFGNLKKYIDESEAGICIDPLSYDEFESSIISLFDPKNRKTHSENGLKYVRENANFEKEGVNYIRSIENLTK